LIEEEKINHGWLAGRRAKMGGNMGWMDGWDRLLHYIVDCFLSEESLDGSTGYLLALEFEGSCWMEGRGCMRRCSR
jgi:hypothetical protein